MKTRTPHLALTWGLAAFLLTGCDAGDMRNEGRIKPMAPSTFFPDGQSARPLVTGTVPRNPRWHESNPTTRPSHMTGYPTQVTMSTLQRGQAQYNIFCAVCHGATGHGDGMIVRRGFTRPPSFHIQRLRDAPPSHVYDVITNGFGAMYSYNDRVAPEDRWAIAAYIRALQLSQHAQLSDLPEEERRKASEARP